MCDGFCSHENVTDAWITCKKHRPIKKEEQMNESFPKSESKFLRTDIFQDNEVPLTFLGWDKEANKDVEIKGSLVGWKQRLKYCLRYSYPEFAIDEAGEKRLSKDGKPFVNKNWDSKFPQGYFINYFFEEGQLTTGSLPLWEAFCMLRPRKGDRLLISKTGKDKETKWRIVKSSCNIASASDLPEIQLEEDHDQSPF